MRPVSAALLRTLRGSHSVAFRARICTAYQEGTDPDGVEIPILDGTVTLDGNADIRSTLDLTTVYAWPSRTSTTLAPYGDEIYVERGVDLGGGSIEWVGLGYHRVNTIGQDNAPKGAIRVDATDRMSGIVDDRLLAPVQFSASTTYGQAVEYLVLGSYPDATIEWDDATYADTLGRSVVAEDDRYGVLHELVKSLGKIMYWDHRGFFVIKDLPDQTTPVWSVNAGPDGVLIDASRSLTREGVTNIVVAYGEAADDLPPVRGIARDADPASPTYYAGRFGPVPRFFSSPLLKTVDQCKAAARTILLKGGLGLPYCVEFNEVVNPALEPFDPVELRLTDGGVEQHSLSILTVPLVPEQPQSASTREQTLVIVGEV